MDSSIPSASRAPLEKLLRTLGYEICDTKDGEWYWRIGEFDSSRVQALEQSADAAVAAATQDCLRSCSALLVAAKVVLGRWEKGDLAAAVRDLQVGVDAFEGQRRPAAETDAGAAEADRQSAWLVKGEAHDGPWTDAAYLEEERAIGRAREIVQQWIDDGHDFSSDEAAATLRRGEVWVGSDRMSIEVYPIEIVGPRKS